ncbi:MAG: phospholipid/cholesterol/gamma-HCH transport system substrate-binding protein, partial [Actinomycetota bacterium]|nr:phospholipid/cholesterol/gamma-HCH transport system substrate-binding protein [Actinomycetota bacterium]
MKSFRERRPWLVGSISLILLIVAVTFAFSLNKLPALRGVYSISADLKDAAGLQSGNEVRIAGVRVGRVTGVHLTPQSARVTMEIRRDVHIPQESRVAVKLATLLGQKFIDIQMPDAYLRAVQNGTSPSD